MHRDFTATVYILENKKTLLVFHQKFKKWLPPGGHVEKNETPTEAAKREVFEETGLDMEWIRQENVWIHYPHARSIERPYLCLLEDIPSYNNTPAHQHVDFIYLAKPVYPPHWKIREDCRWFNTHDLALLRPGKDVFRETLDILGPLLI